MSETQSVSAAPFVTAPNVLPAKEALNKQIMGKDKPKGFSVSKNPPVSSPIKTPEGIELVKESTEVQSLIDLAKQKTSQDVLLESEGKKPSSEKPIEAKPDTTLDEIDGLGDISQPPNPPLEPPPSKKGNKELNFRKLEEKATKAEAELQSLQSKYAELEATLEKTAIEKTPKFQEKFLKPRQEAETAAKSLVKELEMDDSIVGECLALKGAARLRYIDEHFESVTAATEFLRLVNDVDAKQAALETALSNHKTTKLEMVETERLEEVKKKDVALQNFDGMAKQIATKLSLFREIDGDDDHNTAVANRLEMARKIVDGEASPADVMSAPFLAVVARDYIKRCSDLTKELQRYKSRVKEDAEAEPRVNGGGHPSGPIGDGKPTGALASIRRKIR